MNTRELVDRMAFIRTEILDLVSEAESILKDIPLNHGEIATYADDWIMNVRIHVTGEHGYPNVCAAETMDDTIERLRRWRDVAGD